MADTTDVPSRPATTPRSVLVTGGNRASASPSLSAWPLTATRWPSPTRGSGAPDGLFGVQCDVTDAESVDKAFAEVEAHQGPVEVLVANAGITDNMLLMRLSEESFEGHRRQP